MVCCWYIRDSKQRARSESGGAGAGGKSNVVRYHLAGGHKRKFGGTMQRPLGGSGNVFIPPWLERHQHALQPSDTVHRTGPMYTEDANGRISGEGERGLFPWPVTGKLQ